MMQHKDLDFLVKYSCRLSRAAAVIMVSLNLYFTCLYICLVALSCAIDIILMRKFQTGIRSH